MHRVTFAALVLALAASCAAAAESGNSSNSAPPTAGAETPRAKDDVSQLKPHEQHLYRRDMEECRTMGRVERQLCERGVRSKAHAKVRRRAGH